MSEVDEKCEYRSGDMEEHHVESLRQLVRQSFSGAAENLVLKACDCAAERFDDAFADQARAAGILLAQHADHIVVASAFLAPLRRRELIDFTEVESQFGQQSAALVEGVFREDILYAATEQDQEENLRRFLKSISGGLRALVLRIGLRLAEVERLEDQDANRCHDVARETMELYVPLADRMGMGTLRTRLEDTCFRILEPSIHQELAQRVEPIRAEDELCLDLLRHDVERLLQEHGLGGRVSGRTKGLYSLYRKMCRLNCALPEIMDRIGLRIILSSEAACYQALKLLHGQYRPVPATFDDYIAHPKENGYQSLHTCVYPVPELSHKPVEFQIRTESMHREALFGVAAHWLYKSDEEARASGAGRLEWLRSLMAQRDRADSHAEFIQHLRQQVFDNDVDQGFQTRSDWTRMNADRHGQTD